MLVAIDGVAGAQRRLDGVDGCDIAGIIVFEHAEQTDGEDRGIDIGAVVGRRERADLVVPAVGDDVVLDLLAEIDPLGAFTAEHLACDLDSPVDGDPAHDLGVHVMAWCGPHFPDALVGLRPALLDGGDEVLDEAPVARR